MKVNDSLGHVTSVAYSTGYDVRVQRPCLYDRWLSVAAFINFTYFMSTQHQLQLNNKTYVGRYWHEHNILRRYFSSDKDLSILSFGCSTGEELLGMKILFPNAKLYGCDIDWQNLLGARALLGNTATIFKSNDAEISAHGPYDIVLCNSVLLSRTIQKNGRKLGISPSLWIDVLYQIDKALKSGGVLQIVNSNIPFRLHPMYCHYLPLRSDLYICPNFSDLFGISGEHFCTGVRGVGFSSMLPRHFGEECWQELSPHDLHDVHFQKIGDSVGLAAVDDEIIPNLPYGAITAQGTTSYRPYMADEGRTSTYMEIDVAWESIGVEAVRLKRDLRRVWFDGSVPYEATTTVDLIGPSASVFIESTTGRRSTRLSVDSLLSPEVLRTSLI